MGFLAKLFGRDKAKWKTLLKDDLTLSKVVDVLLESCEYTVINGKQSSALSLALARKHPHREFLASEPKPEMYHEASNEAHDLKNVYLYNKTPNELIESIRSEKQYLLERDVIILLHVEGGGGNRRFFDEVAVAAEFFRSGWVITIGCEVPGQKDYAGLSHRGRLCSIENLKPHLKGCDFEIYMPNLSTPLPHKLNAPGWALIAVGNNAQSPLPSDLEEYVEKPKPKAPHPDRKDS